MQTRRRFMAATAAATAALSFPATIQSASPDRHFLQRLAGYGGSPESLARDETYWHTVQQAFTVDRSIIHLNTGGVCPTPAIVQRAEAAHQQEAYRRPFYAHQGEMAPQIEAVRRQLADCFGCDSDELALTRNTSEGMEICQLGFRLEPGDEVLTTDQDYPRMLNTWEQRVAREGIMLQKVPIQVPLNNPESLIKDLQSRITDRTRLIMCCHMIDLTGQILPIKEITTLAHSHGIPLLVDGAQTFGHIEFECSELGCDFFATSLHKWSMGPQGTGMLYIRRDRIADLWPLMPARQDRSEDIRKFEDVGTQSPARFLALGEATAFRQSVGPAAISARLRFLRDYWIERLVRFDRVKLQTNLDAACALATIDVDGIDPLELRSYLWTRHRIRVRPIRHDAVKGIRVSAGMHTTIPELDRFIAVMESVIRHGLPST